MRVRLIKGIGAASFIAVLAVSSVPAVAADLAYDVSFSFMVNGETLPPGIYRLSSMASVLVVQGVGQNAAVTSIRVQSRKETQAKLVFHKLGDQYILRQAWMGGRSGREVPEPQLERELREAARSGKAAAQLEEIAVPAM